MDTQPEVAPDTPPSTPAPLPIDPLRRVFVPIEKRNVHGDWVFHTADGMRYTRHGETGVIRGPVKIGRSKKDRRKLRTRAND